MRKFLTSDTAWKIYSVLIAIILWCFVVYNQNPNSTREVKDVAITIVNHDAIEQAGLVYVQNDDLKLDVKVSGKRLAVAKAERMQALVTVPNIRVGTYDLPIEVRTPTSEIEITYKSRETVRVVVEKRVEKVFPIEVVINGAGEEERKLLKTQMDAESVLLVGPESIINNIGRVYVSISKHDVGKKIKADLNIENRRGDNMSENPNIHTSFDAVNISMAKLTSVQTAVQATIEGTPAHGYAVKSITLSPETVLLGTQQKNDNKWLEAVATLPISVEGKKESFTQTVALDIPEAYELLETSDSIKVTVEIGLEKVEE